MSKSTRSIASTLSEQKKSRLKKMRHRSLPIDLNNANKLATIYEDETAHKVQANFGVNPEMSKEEKQAFLIEEARKLERRIESIKKQLEYQSINTQRRSSYPVSRTITTETSAKEDTETVRTAATTGNVDDSITGGTNRPDGYNLSQEIGERTNTSRETQQSGPKSLSRWKA